MAYPLLLISQERENHILVPRAFSLPRPPQRGEKISSLGGRGREKALGTRMRKSEKMYCFCPSEFGIVLSARIFFC